jgi:2-methylcitrate dehydratase PrpD
VAIEKALSELLEETSSDGIGDGARSAAARQLFDGIGVALAAAGHEAGAILGDVCREQAGTPQAHVLGTRVRTSVTEAAWANGSLTHLLDFDDTGFSHPTACIMPAAVAMGERVGASGRALLDALVLGYEVFERLALCSRSHEPALRERGLHPTALWGGPAAAGAAGRLLGLTAAQHQVALGLATSSAAGLSQHFGTWAKGLTAGHAARSGVLAALLAQQGYRGDEHGLSGRYGLFSALVGEGAYDLALAASRDHLQEWAIVEPGLSIKPYPACTSTLRAVDAMFQITDGPGYDPQNVAKIVVGVHPDLLHTLRYVAPEDGFRGKFSLDYTVASVALDRKLDIASFSDEAARRPDLRAMLDLVDLDEHPEWEMAARHHNPVEVVFRDGRRARASVSSHRGAGANRLTSNEVRDKFVTCSSGVLGPAQAAAAADALAHIAEVDDVRDLARWLAPAAIEEGAMA